MIVGFVAAEAPKFGLCLLRLPRSKDCGDDIVHVLRDAAEHRRKGCGERIDMLDGTALLNAGRQTNKLRLDLDWDRLPGFDEGLGCDVKA
jgi:hypothetical protein